MSVRVSVCVNVSVRVRDYANMPACVYAPTRVEDLAHGLGDVAVVLEVLGQRGVVAGHLSEVGLQVEDAGRVRTSPRQEGGSAGRARRLLQRNHHFFFHGALRPQKRIGDGRMVV